MKSENPRKNLLILLLGCTLFSLLCMSGKIMQWAGEKQRSMSAAAAARELGKISPLVYPDRDLFLKIVPRNFFTPADDQLECLAHPSWCLFLAVRQADKPRNREIDFLKTDIEPVYKQAGLKHAGLAACVTKTKFQWLDVALLGEKELSGDPGSSFLNEVSLMARTYGLTPMVVNRNDPVAIALVGLTVLDARTETTRQSFGEAQPLVFFDLGDRLLWAALYPGKNGPLLLMVDVLKKNQC